MATMIPDIREETIENDGERALYATARDLPDAYTVLYSYKFAIGESNGDSVTREADFVFVHPGLGYVVVEVKMGQIGFFNSQWHEFKGKDASPLHKDPIEQANTAMYAILDKYRLVTKEARFPLAIRFALCFPECAHMTGELPANVNRESIWTSTSLDNLEQSIAALFPGIKNTPNKEATAVLISKVLSPSFRLYSTLEDQLTSFSRSSARVLTEEQERILDETDEDKRKIFFGAAGTGKSFVAMEKARRLAAAGKRVLLTCFNRNLVEMYHEGVKSPLVTAACFLDYLQTELTSAGLSVAIPMGDLSEFYSEILPDLAFDHYSSLPDEDRFDAIIVDEGQDFKENWYICLDAMLKPDGHYYIFADPKQDLFGNGIDSLKNMTLSKHKLTLNLRNSGKICELLEKMTGEKVRSKLKGGIPTTTVQCKDAPDERRKLEKEIGRLVSQGLSPQRILILSPHRKENSSLADSSKIKEWPLVDVSERKHGIQFCTIRSFKGLEADVVFLIGLKESKVCTPADVYVGASRAKFLLYMFQHEGWEGECSRLKATNKLA